MDSVAARLVLLLACALTLCGSTHIVGYWGAYPGGLQSSVGQITTAVSKGYNVIVYAFYDVDASGGLNQDRGAYPAPSKASINATKSFTYLVSLFGGQNGVAPTLSMDPTSWAQAMYDNFETLHNSLGFDGIDIDLENAWGGTGDKVICGLRAFFKLMHNGGYTVSMAPQPTAVWPGQAYATGSWNSYAPLVDTSVVDFVDILAVQLYNNPVPNDDIAGYASSLESGFQVSGCPNCGDGGTCLVQVPSCKVTFGFPASVGSAPAGCPGQTFASSDKCPYGTVLSSFYSSSSVLKATGGLMTWSIEYDANANWQFVTAATSIAFSGSSCTNVASVTVGVTVTSSSSTHATTSTTSSSTHATTASSSTTSKTTSTSTTSKTTTATSTTTKATTSTSSKTTTASSSTSTSSQSTTGQVVQEPTRLMGYWGSNPNGKTSSVSQVQTAVASGYNTIVFTYYTVDANGALQLESGSITAPPKTNISTQSFTYLVALFGGGASGEAPTLTMTSDAWANALYKNFVTLRGSIGFDGVEIDLQFFAGAWGTSSVQLICGLRTFFQLMKNNGHVVAIAPHNTGLFPEVSEYTQASWNSFAPLVDSGILLYVDIVSIQLYNDAAVPYSDAGKYATALMNGYTVTGCPNCTTGEPVTGQVQIPLCKLAFGWPASSSISASCSGISGGCPYGSSLSTLYSGSSTLTNTGGVGTWSIEYDSLSNWQFITAAKSIKFTSCSVTSPSSASSGQSTTDDQTTTADQSTTTTAPIDKIKGSATLNAPSLIFSVFLLSLLYCFAQ